MSARPSDDDSPPAQLAGYQWTHQGHLVSGPRSPAESRPAPAGLSEPPPPPPLIMMAMMMMPVLSLCRILVPGFMPAPLAVKRLAHDDGNAENGAHDGRNERLLAGRLSPGPRPSMGRLTLSCSFRDSEPSISRLRADSRNVHFETLSRLQSRVFLDCGSLTDPDRWC